MEVFPGANKGEPGADDVGDLTIGIQNPAGPLPTGGNPQCQSG